MVLHIHCSIVPSFLAYMLLSLHSYAFPHILAASPYFFLLIGPGFLVFSEEGAKFVEEAWARIGNI